MILTCYVCPRQISFPGSDRRLFAARFGWHLSAGRYFCGDHKSAAACVPACGLPLKGGTDNPDAARTGS